MELITTLIKFNKITMCKITDCKRCDISHFRNTIVNGHGNIKGGIFFIGEAPGYMEDKTGLPFVGNSGELLTKTLNLFGIDRKKVYITNIVKCRPYSMYGNRAPSVVEINNCKEYIQKELEVGNPKIVVLLGGTAVKSYFGVKDLHLNKVLGSVIELKGRYIVPTYHPSYVLRNKDNDWILKKHIDCFTKVANLYRENINPLIQFKI